MRPHADRRRAPSDLRANLLLLLLLALAASASACAGAPAAPDPDRVAIVVDVTGGLAPVDYRYRIDGRSGAVTIERCRAGCDADPGRIIGILPRARVNALTRRLVEAGFLDFLARDFGLCAGCADHRSLVLAYIADDVAHITSGDEPNFPPALLDLFHDLERAVAEAGEAGR